MTSTRLELPPKRTRTVSDDPRAIEQAVNGVIQFAMLPRIFVDRRAHQRITYTQLFSLTPVNDAEEMATCGETIHVVGKNLSPTGIGFFHHDPIPSRYVVISLQQSRESYSQYLVKISWCRFLHPGWYDSGGQIVRIVKWQE
ncbi:hypothetical protein ACFL2H_02875 [Planctomycetota bacterium]